jgi:AraC family transcriptional regulator of adaptative response/methylated-DNA-[protein]-cysteine methyltransferase
MLTISSPPSTRRWGDRRSEFEDLKRSEDWRPIADISGQARRSAVLQPNGNVIMTTATMRDKIDGTVHPSLRYASGSCSLGAILVAFTDVGVRAILLGDERAALVRDLEERFPAARLLEDQGGPWLAKAVACAEAPALDLDMPLDPQGTQFQQRVWQTLREIPAGTTVSYRDIARRIGEPTAARAVAEACAANAIAVAIPCHRVRREDSALSGYRWGTNRKRLLLDREAAAWSLVARS